MDENLLAQTGGWDLNIAAEGDFKELAQNLHQLCENYHLHWEFHVLTQDSIEAQEVV